MYCPKCGAQIDDASKFCGKCGASIDTSGYIAPPPVTQQQARPPQHVEQTSDGNIVAVLGFIFAFIIPVVGLVLSIIGAQKEQYRGLAVAGIVISLIAIVLLIVAIVIIVSHTPSAPSYYYY